jgi:hypothetical protein
MDTKEIATNLFNEVLDKRMTVFTVVYSPGSTQFPEGYRVIRPTETHTLRYTLREPWRIVGTYYAKNGFEYLVEDMAWFEETKPQRRVKIVA